MATVRKSATKAATATTAVSKKSKITPATDGGGESGATKKRSSHTRRDTHSFDTYLYRVLKSVHGDIYNIKKSSLATLDDIIHNVLERVAREASGLLSTKHKATMTSREIQTAVRLVFRGELAKHAVAQGTKAVTTYHTNSDKPQPAAGDKTTKQTKSKRSGILFPVGRIARLLKQAKFATRTGEGTSVYLAAVLEYLAAEILELAGNAAKDNKKKTIAPRHIMLAIENDEELARLCRGSISRAGVVPHIEDALKPKSNKKSDTEEGGDKNKAVVTTKKKNKKTKTTKKKSTSAAAPAPDAPAEEEAPAAEDAEPMDQDEE